MALQLFHGILRGEDILHDAVRQIAGVSSVKGDKKTQVLLRSFGPGFADWRTQDLSYVIDQANCNEMVTVIL